MFRILTVTAGLAFFLAQANAQPADAAKRAYESRCDGCHGEDGAGGGHGPNIVDLAQPRATTVDALKELIRKGVPDAGMPAFPIADNELTLIAGYVAALRAPAGDHPVEGDAAAGQRFFEGKGNCSSCHMVRGNGGLLGPDLSNLARQRKLGQIEQALRDPGSVQAAAGRGGAGGGGRRGGGPAAYAATVHLRSGQNIHGLVRNASDWKSSE